MLNAGTVLRHIESGTEAEYLHAIPTAASGFLHLLRTGSGYVYRLTGDLETEFARKDETRPLSATDGTATSNEAALLDALISRLKQEGVIPGGSSAPAAPTAVPADVAPAAPAEAPGPAPAQEPAPSEAPAPVDPQTVTPPPPTLPDVSAHLPADTTPDAPAPSPADSAPPSNSIPL